MEERFGEWAEKHGKKYTSESERIKRMNVFGENEKEIERLNKENKGTTEFSVNQFADMTTSEFKNTVRKNLSLPLLSSSLLSSLSLLFFSLSSLSLPPSFLSISAETEENENENEKNSSCTVAHR